MEINAIHFITRLRSNFSLKNFSMRFWQSRNCTFGPRNIAQCYSVLGVPNQSDQEAVRQAFLDLVKRFHPDSKGPEADSAKFQQIETAYRTLQEHFSQQRFKKDDCEGEFGLYYQEKEEIEDHDIQHTAPQHRQYLSYGGYGSGTPTQRQRQFTQYRAAKAVENVTEYRISKLQDKYSQALVSKENDRKKKVKDIRTGFGMDRLVEDLIQESISKGEFDNLSCAGKPLKPFQSHNPYVDFVTHKMNEVLIDNGFTPQWITLQKEIRDQTQDVRETLMKVRKKLGPLPLDEDENEYWKDEIIRISDRVKDINGKIDLYNLVVPILNKQMFHLNLDAEAKKILEESPPGNRVKIVKLTDQEIKNSTDPRKKHLLDIISDIF